MLLNIVNIHQVIFVQKNALRLFLQKIKEKIFGIYKIMEDYNEKWYIIGTIIGIFAGIAIGWLMFGLN